MRLEYRLSRSIRLCCQHCGALTACQHLLLTDFCKPIAYPLSTLCARYRFFSTGDYQSCFSSIYAGASGLAILTTRQLGVSFLTLALVARIFQSGQRNSRFKRCLEQSWLNFAYFSDLVCQVNISFTSDINFWHMIGVRAPASPHGLARIRRKTTLCACLVDAANISGYYDPGVSQAMTVEPDRMH